MNGISIIKRKLKPGKTYEDFRKAWYHEQGFGVKTTMYSMINAFDPSEIIVIGMMDITSRDELDSVLTIDIEERLTNNLDDIIEPNIERNFAALVAIDDFSPEGILEYQPAAINGEKTDLEAINIGLKSVVEAITEASNTRDKAKATEIKQVKGTKK